RDNNDPVAELFNVKPNNLYNGYLFKFILVANALLNGEAFAQIIRDRKGNQMELLFRPNNSVVVKMDKDTNYNLEYWVRLDAPRDLYVAPKDMIHIKFFSVDGITGRSPLHSLKHDLNTQEGSKKFMRSEEHTSELQSRFD